MADPLTIATVASTVVGAASSIRQGNIAKARAKEAAAQRDLETQRQLAQLKRESGERKARNRALRAAYGGDSTGRSALALTAENQRRDASNQLAASITGRSASRGILLQGKEDSTRAYGDALSTVFAGGKSLIAKN